MTHSGIAREFADVEIAETAIVMRPISSILVPVGNYSARSLPAVTKAAQLAAALSAKLELFHDIADPIAIDVLDGPKLTLRAFKANVRRSAIEGLERLAAPLRARGLRVSTAAAWDYPPYEAILRRAVAIGADMIVAPRRDRHRLPALLGYTDWELLRLSPVPVLLVKTSTPYHRPTVLAAIDPTHAHAKPTALDQRILDYGINERDARQTFDDALGKSTIPALRRHLVRGDPAAAIPATARKTRSAIVVIGAVSRSALKRLFIGNTAERVMDELRCDLLVVKPAKFALKGPRARRGPRFISTAPQL
jgi:universal stress protein E